MFVLVPNVNTFVCVSLRVCGCAPDIVCKSRDRETERAREIERQRERERNEGRKRGGGKGKIERAEVLVSQRTHFACLPMWQHSTQVIYRAALP